MSEFVKVAEIGDVPPGRQKTVVVQGLALALFHVNGEIFATADACPHERVSLGKGGCLEGYIITCGYHHWSFNIRTGESDDGMDEYLPVFPVRVMGSDICVLLPPMGRQGSGMDV